MNGSTRKVLAAISDAVDTFLLTGRVKPVSNPPSTRGMPDGEELRNFRRLNLSPRIRAEITRLLSTRRNDVTVTEDILVSRHQPEWGWRHDEMQLRARIFELLEIAEVAWDLVDCPPGLRRDGWLLVEDGHIIGATEFRQELTDQGRRWFWFWLFVDPEYRRQGAVTRRLPIWEGRYPGMIIDQPNPAMWRIIHRAGLHLRTPVKGPSLWIGDERIFALSDPYAPDVPGLPCSQHTEYPQPKASRAPSRFNQLSALSEDVNKDNAAAARNDKRR
jgi:hypothetical protein